MNRSHLIDHVCASITLAIVLVLHVSASSAETGTSETTTDAQGQSLLWGAEVNDLWSTLAGNIYRAQLTL